MFRWLKSLFGVPEPAGPPQLLRSVSIQQPTITQDIVTLDADGWRIEAQGPAESVRLFEISVANLEQCMITYRAEVRTESLAGKCYLEMWCRVPGRGEFFSKGLNQTVTGTTAWSQHEIPFYLRAGQKADLLKLNLAVEGTGSIWLRRVEIYKTPLTS